MTSPLQERDRFVAAVRERLAQKRSRLAPQLEPPEADRRFEEKYRYLVDSLRRTFEAVGEPGLEVEPFGSSGLRISFRVADPQGDDAALVDREIRVSRLDATEEVHLVFSSYQRAERHATFKLTRPNLPRVEAAFVDFLVEGIEPRWLSRRPREDEETAADASGRASAEGDPRQQTLELPFD